MSAFSSQSLAPLLKELERFEMKVTLEKGRRLNAQMLSNVNNWTADRLLESVREFRRDVDAELNKRRFALLISPNDQYFEQRAFFVFL